MPRWEVERIVHFEPGDFVVDGVGHFGFHARDGRYYALAHDRHFAGPVGADGAVEWTIAPRPVFPGVRNIVAELEFPMFVDVLPGGSLLLSNFGNARLYRIDSRRTTAKVLVDGSALGLVDMGNCVVDDDGCIWVSEVRGCRLWRFDARGEPLETLGDGTPGFQPGPTGFDRVQFGWIYDLRPGPGGMLYVLDSGNFALRAVHVSDRTVHTVAGTGAGGYDGDGADAREATFGTDPQATFDGPISLSVDEDGNAYVGDRFNQVVRMIERESGVITTIAGRAGVRADRRNDPAERDPLRLSLPRISSMDYAAGRLFVPTDLDGGAGDLAVLRRA